MSEPSDFLARWSRRKRAAAELKSRAQTTVADAAAEDARAAPPAAPAQEQEQCAPQPAGPVALEFDPASLPSLDSIAADTDIRAFLQPGVPAELRHAALRRAWAADPAIRDFRGLQENDWDFNDPDKVPGFGKLGPDFDIRKMAAQVFGDDPDGAEPPPATDPQSLPAAQKIGAADSAEAASDRSAAVSDAASRPSERQEMMQCKQYVATREEQPSETVDRAKSRRHGGAIPRIISKD